MTNLEYIKLHPQEFSELDHKLVGVLGLYMIDYGYTIDDILSDKELYNDKGINDMPSNVRIGLRELLKERR
jgi:hypothetical protein